MREMVRRKGMETGAGRIRLTPTEVRELLEQEARNLRLGRRVYRAVLTLYGVAAAVFVGWQLYRIRPDAGRPFGPSGSSVALRPATPGPIVRANDAPEPADTPPPVEASVLTPPVEAAPTPILRLDRIPWDFVLLITGAGWLVFAGARRALRVQKHAAGMLALLDDPLAVGPLSECLRIDDGQVRRLTHEALVRLLPQIRPNDAHSLTDDQHRCLNHALAGKDTDLSRAILAAYEQVGDGRDLVAVEELADGRSPASKNARVREAAQECVPYLRLRAQKQRAAQTYLRPSAVTDGDAALLRAAAQSDAGDLPFLLHVYDETETATAVE
jgi:hypothetical protein